MFLKLLALFTIIPLIELALLIPLGMQIGLWPTIALVVGTAVLGAFLGKLEGKRAWSKIKSELGEGKIPRDSLLDGLAVLLAGAFLVTPGVLTDVAAMILLLPPARKPVKAYARKKIKGMLDSGQLNVVSSGSFSMFDTPDPKGAEGGGARPFRQSPFGRQDDEEVIDVTPGEGDKDSSPTEPSRDEKHDHIGN